MQVLQAMVRLRNASITRNKHEPMTLHSKTPIVNLTGTKHAAAIVRDRACVCFHNSNTRGVGPVNLYVQRQPLL